MKFQVYRQWNGDPAPGWGGLWVFLEPRADALKVHVDAPRCGDPPPDAPPGRCWGLWEHEVVEVFVAGPSDEYIELEVGPHGHYLALGMSGIREVADDDLPVTVQWPASEPGRWRAQIIVPRKHLPAGPWRANAFAIHGVGVTRRWLAAHPLPGNTPDFHQPQAFPVQTGS